MKEYNQEDYIMLSGIQHYAFCTRQWALIHIETAWKENVHTVVGNLFHDKAHSGMNEKRREIIISRSLPINSRKHGISGECDIVEFHKDENGVNINGRSGKYIPYPIEYKKGSPKTDNIDILQLTAQVICLEEMFCCNIKYGYLFYGKTKRREKIMITLELKEEVSKLFFEMHNLLEKGNIPKIKPTKKCRQCSLADVCLPTLSEKMSVKNYIDKKLKEDEYYEKVV